MTIHLIVLIFISLVSKKLASTNNLNLKNYKYFAILILETPSGLLENSTNKLIQLIGKHHNPKIFKEDWFRAPDVLSSKVYTNF